MTPHFQDGWMCARSPARTSIARDFLARPEDDDVPPCPGRSAEPRCFPVWMPRREIAECEPNRRETPPLSRLRFRRNIRHQRCCCRRITTSTHRLGRPGGTSAHFFPSTTRDEVRRRNGLPLAAPSSFARLPSEP